MRAPHLSDDRARSTPRVPLTAFVLIAIPGPSVFFVISRGVTLGRHAALATIARNTTGVLEQVIAVAVGIGAIVQRSALVFDVMMIVGAAYLVFLGVGLGLPAGSLRAWPAQSPRRLERLGGAGGLAVVGLGIRLAVSCRHDLTPVLPESARADLRKASPGPYKRG